MVILLMVTAAAIPIMAPALENRRMREAARMASTFISGARAKAIQRGREVGVVLQRFEGQPYAMTMSYVEVPPPYGGDTTGATCKAWVYDVIDTPGLTGYTDYKINIRFNADFNPTMVRVGDKIRFGYQGLEYTVTGPDVSPVDGVIDAAFNPVKAVYTAPTPLDSAGSQIYPPFDRPRPMPWVVSPSDAVPTTPPPTDVSYQIIRQPMRTSDQPMTLPDGIIIDLLQSNMGLNATGVIFGDWTIDADQWPVNPPAIVDPVITFTPSGGMGHVVTTQTQRATGPVFLLLGRRELMPDVARSRTDENFSQPNVTNPPNLYLQNFWITIGHQTGLVTTAEMATNPFPGSFPNARAIAITSQSMGGR
jgi:hypothetical protein